MTHPYTITDPTETDTITTTPTAEYHHITHPHPTQPDPEETWGISNEAEDDQEDW